MRTLSNHAALQQVSQPAADGERLAAILSIPAAADDKAGWAYRIPHELAEYDCFVESDPEDEQLVSWLGEASVLDKPLALFLSASQAGAAQRLADAASKGGACLVRIVVVHDGGNVAAAAAVLEGVDVPTTWVDDLSGSPVSCPGAAAVFAGLRESLAKDVSAAASGAVRAFEEYNATRPHPDAYPWRPLLSLALAEHGGEEALIDEETALTLRQAYERAQAYADAFEARGCAEPSSRRVVGIYLPWSTSEHEEAVV